MTCFSERFRSISKKLNRKMDPLFARQKVSLSSVRVVFPHVLFNSIKEATVS